jgi:hypothetical protein
MRPRLSEGCSWLPSSHLNLDKLTKPCRAVSRPKPCFKNLTGILKRTGYTYDDTVSARIYLSDFDRDFALFHTVYPHYFQQTSRVCRPGPPLGSRGSTRKRSLKSI